LQSAQEDAREATDSLEQYKATHPAATRAGVSEGNAEAEPTTVFTPPLFSSFTDRQGYNGRVLSKT
jgi:hypothetical protein